ncbi:MAG: YdjY domain-containing protein [Bradymonadia bacterium]
MKLYAYLILGTLIACSGKDDSGSRRPPSSEPKPEIKEKNSANPDKIKTPPPSDFKDENKQAGEQFWVNSSADLSTGEKINTPPPVRRIDAEHFAIGQFIVNQKEKWIRIKSKVNQQQEILEYLSCGPRGKLHECVFLSFGVPSHLHLALLLIGGQPGGGDYGSEVTITAEWKDPKTGVIKKHPAAHFLYDRLKLKKGQGLLWSFVGSKFVQGRYEANYEQSLIAVINDSQAVIGIKSIVGNAHKGPNQGFEANHRTIPAKGTPVDLYIHLVE